MSKHAVVYVKLWVHTQLYIWNYE